MRKSSVITSNYKTAGFAANCKEECEPKPLLTYKPHTNSSARNFQHTSYISPATLSQKFSLNAQELKQANTNVFTQGYRGVARNPAEY